MPAEHPVPPELAAAAVAFADAWSERAAGQLAELADALTDARRVRVVPSDRVNVLTVGVTAVPDRVVSEQLDRARVTMVNSGSVTVSLGTGPELTTDRSNRFDLAAGASLTIDTRAAWWAVVAAGSEGELSVISEEYDA